MHTAIPWKESSMTNGPRRATPRATTLTRLQAICFTIVVTACSAEPGPGAPSPIPTSLAVSGLPSSVTAGAGVSGTITVMDASGNTAIGYGGTVRFSSTDPAAQLPANYTFVPSDRGTHPFTATFRTAGMQTLTATDMAASSINGSETVSVTAQASAPSRIAFHSKRGIEEIDTDGLARTVLIADSTAFEPAWSPDGSTLAFTRTADGWNACEIYTARADGSGAQQITTPLTQPWCANSPAWSPDGRKIAFAGGPAGGCLDTPRCFGQSIYVVNADGSNAKQLFTAASLPAITNYPNMRYVLLAAPTWSPDGTQLVFECWAYGFGPGPDYFNFLCTGDAAGSSATRLVGCCPMAPAWSPDGSQIASSNYGITLLNADGSVATILTTHASADSTDSDPAWSSDGAHLVFARGISYGDVYINPDLFIINRDGTGLRRLTTTGDAYHPTWRSATPVPLSRARALIGGE
jgi:Tol biopolymer transport system component